MPSPLAFPIRSWTQGRTISLDNIHSDLLTCLPSDIRQIPDNQEVWLDRFGSTSIIIDISKRVASEEIYTDEQAFGFHIEDSADPKDRLCVYAIHRETMRMVAHAPAYLTVAITRPKEPNAAASGNSDVSANESDIQFTATAMILLRLEEQDTDILISVNIPYQGDRWAINDALEPFQEPRPDEFNHAYDIISNILDTFNINDWGLFVED